MLPSAGYYTCVEVIFTLRRQVGFYMMGVYAPTLLIVVLSWLSFWINPDASAARVPLGTNKEHSFSLAAPNDTEEKKRLFYTSRRLGNSIQLNYRIARNIRRPQL